MDITRAPFFTVIIPTFNRKELLKEAVRSVLDQTFKDFEIIIVDDHSTDGTSDIVPLFGDNRIRYVINNHKKGLSGARNSGIDQARGIWTAFLDDDDIWFSEKLSRVYERIMAVDDSTGLIYTGYSCTNPKGGLSSVLPSKEGWVQIDILYKNFIGSPSVVTVRTDILRLVGGCDESFCFFEDGDLYIRVSGLSKVAFVRDALTYVRTSNSDRLSFKYDRRISGYKLFRRKHKKLIDKSLKLRHRAASRIFVYAVLSGKVIEAIKTLPWTLFGVAVDISNMRWIFGTLSYPLRRRLHVLPKSLL